MTGTYGLYCISVSANIPPNLTLAWAELSVHSYGAAFALRTVRVHGKHLRTTSCDGMPNAAFAEAIGTPNGDGLVRV